LIYTGDISGTKNEILEALAGTSNWGHNETTPVVLTPGGTGFPGTQPIFQLPPSVADVTSSTADNAYGIGAEISIQVVFSVPVNVTLLPQLGLNSGGTANYFSGSGTNTLTFRYTV